MKKDPRKVKAGNKLKRRLIARYGRLWRSHYRAIGARGGRRTAALYQIVPLGTGGYGMRERASGRIRATFGPVPQHVRAAIAAAQVEW